jgi:hypothetical protein
MSKSLSEQLVGQGLVSDRERFVEVTLTYEWFGKYHLHAFVGPFTGIEEAKLYASRFRHEVSESTSISINDEVSDTNSLRFRPDETPSQVWEQMTATAYKKWGPAGG